MLRQQDLRTDFSLTEANPPVQNIVFEIGVVCKGKNFGSQDTSGYTYKQIISQDDIETLAHPDELPELKGGWTGKSFHLWAIDNPDILKELEEEVAGKCRTLLYTANMSGISASSSVPFDGVIALTLKTDRPWENEDLKPFPLQENHCSFVDNECDGKVLYTFLSLLSDYPVVKSQTAIENDDFSSVFRTKTQRDVLIQNAFSFWMQAQDTTFLWDVYAGGRQIQATYSYFILQEEIGYAISSWIRRGQRYSDNALLNLKGEVSTALANLKTLGVIAGYDISYLEVSGQLAGDKVKGIIRGFNVDFDEQYRIAKVQIQITGEIS